MSGYAVISEVPGDGIGWIATPDIAVPQLDGGGGEHAKVA
jgi:hypothetical protein